MLIAVCILAALVVVLLAVIVFQARRPSVATIEAEAKRRQVVLGDHGDDIVWEVGKLRPIVDTNGLFDAKLSKRSFLRRVAFGVSVFSMGWLASHGRNVAWGAELPRSKSPENDPFGHEGLAGHADAHSDGGGGGKNHGDVHSDAPGN